jgi:hypothetical protein
MAAVFLNSFLSVEATCLMEPRLNLSVRLKAEVAEFIFSKL